MHTQDFLLELGTEELPAKLLPTLAKALAENIAQGLQKAGLSYDLIRSFATPRRLSVSVAELQTQQPDRAVERKGPALRAAFDEAGNPTPALQGFARSCNTTVDKLTKLETAHGAWYVYRYQESGKSVFELLPEIVTKAFANLPIPKPMFWSNLTTAFIRPVHWLLMIYGSEVVPATILGLAADRLTYGHRFHYPEPVKLFEVMNYTRTLRHQGYVIADFNERRDLIRDQVINLADKIHGTALMSDTLLEEVTGLVEWPVALLVPFDQEFLTVPQEALIAAMETHQKSFPLLDQNQQLMPYFITVSNIESRDQAEVIKGNERVMRARLADAKFFYETDSKNKLADSLETLKHIVFQAKLGSLYDKSERIAKLAGFIAATHKEQAERAGLLSKADLASNMVGEFPELQGIMGGYYALHDEENPEVAAAIREHYLPRFAGDALPASNIGCAVALADRIDTLIGIFGINQLPTGEKDPFALRRAALAVLRILIEKELDLNLEKLLSVALQNYQQTLPNKEVVKQVQEFILERLRAYYQEQKITPDTLAAVLAVQKNNPLDIQRRVQAVQAFRALPESQSLAAANKRVSNLLKQAEQLQLTGNNDGLRRIELSLLTTEIEHALYNSINDKLQKHLQNSEHFKNYTERLTDLASLREPVDRFFDTVLVMDENEKLRNNRLALLASLRKLFLAVADISLLQG